MVSEGTPTRVQLHLYDLSQGMARVMSAQLLGKQLDGIWHTGIVAYGQEFYFGGGIQCGTPGCTHFGRPLQVIDLGETHIPRRTRGRVRGGPRTPAGTWCAFAAWLPPGVHGAGRGS